MFWGINIHYALWLSRILVILCRFCGIFHATKCHHLRFLALYNNAFYKSRFSLFTLRTRRTRLKKLPFCIAVRTDRLTPNLYHLIAGGAVSFVGVPSDVLLVCFAHRQLGETGRCISLPLRQFLPQAHGEGAGGVRAAIDCVECHKV